MNNNKLIAEFLGLELQEDGTYYDNESNEFIALEDLNYNSSWDMLMVLIRHIEQLPDVYEIEEFLLIRDEIITGRIEHTYDACIEFIEWFNENRSE